MAGILNAIDLRSPEYKASKRIISPACIKLIYGIIFIYIITGSYLGLRLYIDNLNYHLASENAELQLLSFKKAVLNKETDEILQLQKQQKLVKDLSSGYYPFTVYICAINEASEITNVSIKKTYLDHSGTFIVSGTANCHQSIAIFNQSLNDLSIFKSAAITSTELAGPALFYFSIEGILSEMEVRALNDQD